MHRNQYLISTEKGYKNLPNFRIEKFDKLNIYLESNLSFQKKSLENIEVGFIGIFFDPLKPHLSGEKLLREFFKGPLDLNAFFKNIEKLSGRFVALYRKDEAIYIVGDFRHSKKILYSFQQGFSVITSSLNLYYELFDDKPNYDLNLKTFFESDLFKSKEQDWYGNKTVDLRFKKLLPNHSLNLTSKEIERIPFYHKTSSLEEVFEINYQILKGTYEYIIENHKIIQPITAGWDSRILLSASMPYKDKIKYYIFKRQEHEFNSDVTLSKKIAEKLHLNFYIYDVESFKEDFITDYKRHTHLPNFLSKTKNIQHHFFHHGNIPNLINVSGVMGNLLRNVFGCSKRKVFKRKELHCLNPYGPYQKITTREIDLWYDDALEYAKSNNISLLDIYYIENRAANWGSIYPFEQDMALEEIDPFSNKSLMFPVLMLKSEYRGFGKNHLSWKLIERFDSSLCQFPFNPHRSAIRMYFYKKYPTNYLYKKLNFMKAKYLKLR